MDIFLEVKQKRNQYKLWVSLKHLGLYKIDDNTNITKEEYGGEHWKRYEIEANNIDCTM